MLGFAPLAAIPLAATLAPLTITQADLSGSTTITFTTAGSAGAFLIAAGEGALTFTPTADLYVDAYSGGTTGLVFGSDADLRLAGDPITFDMVPAALDFRGNWRPAEFDMKPTDLTFRGVKQ